MDTTPSPDLPTFQLSENGAVLAESAQADKCIFFWREAEPIPMMSFRLSRNRNITGYSLSPTLNSIAVMTEDALELYNYTDRQQYRRVISLPSRVAHFAVAPDQSEFAVLADQVLYRYGMPELQQLASETSGFSTITRNAIAYNPYNQQFASTRTLEDRVFEIVIADRTNANSQKVIRIPSEPEERFDAPKLVGLGWIDSDHLIAAVDFRLLVVNTKNGQLESATPQHNPDRQLPSYRAIALSGNRCVTITDNGTLQEWNWTGSELTQDQPAIELQTSVERLAWHPGRDYVVVGTQSGSIQSIDLRLRKSIFADQAVHSGEICGAAWCDAGRLVTASRDGKLALWQNTSGVLKPYVAWDSRSGISAIEVSADGRQCYVASASESISIFDFASMDEAFAQLGIANNR